MKALITPSKPLPGHEPWFNCTDAVSGKFLFQMFAVEEAKASLRFRGYDEIEVTQ